MNVSHAHPLNPIPALHTFGQSIWLDEGLQLFKDAFDNLLAAVGQHSKEPMSRQVGNSKSAMDQAVT